MFARVVLLNGFEKSLWYKVTDQALSDKIIPGAIVRVPLQRRYESAIVLQCACVLPDDVTFTIKNIHGLEPFPQDSLYGSFIQKVSDFYLLRPLYFYQRIRHFLKEHHASDEVIVHSDAKSSGLVTLTDEQQSVVDYVMPRINQSAYTPTLVHGVTGSGKTEVYKYLIRSAIAQNKSVILMFPEVTLALQFEHLLRQQLGDVSIFGFHSASKITEKRLLWDKLVRGDPMLIVGVHLPIMLPIQSLGLIIVDEEHEQGFVEKKHPKLNSKEIALWRAAHYNIPIVLGSATPSINSLYNAQRYGWKTFSITKRFAGGFPTIRKVLLTTTGTKRRNAFWISQELELAIRDRLSRREQIIIFLNRRGYSFFVQCRECGFIFQCPDCSVSLTLHLTPRQLLRCHYCDHTKEMPRQCPTCSAPEKSLLKKGIGTQQVVEILQELFPAAVIERADLDSTIKKRTWQTTVALFQEGKIDILVGTQTITKGYHFPNVTLVGVLWADLNVHFPVYNATETTLQQLLQVAGRAGRQCKGGLVIVQAMRDHEIFEYLNEQQYLAFCQQEMKMRQESFYPPYSRLACIELKHSDPSCIDQDADALAQRLREINEQQELGVHVLGPAYPLISRIQKYEIRHIVLKAATFKAIHHLLADVIERPMESMISVILGQ